MEVSESQSKLDSFLTARARAREGIDSTQPITQEQETQIMARIEITISPTGESKVEGHGFSGPACVRATARWIKALGARIGERKKADYYQQEKHGQQQTLGH